MFLSARVKPGQPWLNVGRRTQIYGQTLTRMSGRNVCDAAGVQRDILTDRLHKGDFADTEKDLENFYSACAKVFVVSCNRRCPMTCAYHTCRY